MISSKNKLKQSYNSNDKSNEMKDKTTLSLIKHIKSLESNNLSQIKQLQHYENEITQLKYTITSLKENNTDINTKYNEVSIKNQHIKKELNDVLEENCVLINENTNLLNKLELNCSYISKLDHNLNDVTNKCNEIVNNIISCNSNNNDINNNNSSSIIDNFKFDILNKDHILSLVKPDYQISRTAVFKKINSTFNAIKSLDLETLDINKLSQIIDTKIGDFLLVVATRDEDFKLVVEASRSDFYFSSDDHENSLELVKRALLWVEMRLGLSRNDTSALNVRVNRIKGTWITIFNYAVKLFGFLTITSTTNVSSLVRSDKIKAIIELIVKTVRSRLFNNMYDIGLRKYESYNSDSLFDVTQEKLEKHLLNLKENEKKKEKKQHNFINNIVKREVIDNTDLSCEEYQYIKKEVIETEFNDNSFNAKIKDSNDSNKENSPNKRYLKIIEINEENKKIRCK